MIETLNLFLARPTYKDMLTLENLWRDVKVRQHLGGVVVDDVIKNKAVEIQNHWDLHKFGQYVVSEKATRAIIGLCGLHYTDDGIELSYMFFPQFWGRGFAREAAQACIDYGFIVLKIKKIIAITQAANTRSCQLLEKIGMHHVRNFERFNATQYLFVIVRAKYTGKIKKYSNYRDM